MGKRDIPSRSLDLIELFVSGFLFEYNNTFYLEMGRLVSFLSFFVCLFSLILHVLVSHVGMSLPGLNQY